MKTFYETMALAMAQRGLTAAELSRRTGLYKSYFTKLKKGEAKDVPWTNALLIIKALGMTPNEFYELAQMVDE